jgi:excisionase family DNA binding protein
MPEQSLALRVMTSSRHLYTNLMTNFRHDDSARQGADSSETPAMILLRDAVRALMLELLSSDPEIQQAVASAPGSGIIKLLDTAAFAELTGLHRDTAARLAREGRIPGARRQGREWRFPANDLQILPIVPVYRRPPPARRRNAASTDSATNSAVDAMMRMAREKRAAAAKIAKTQTI